MAKIRDAKLETATARGKLPPRRKPYWVRVGPTVWLGYRAAKRKPGTWSVGGDARRWIRVFGYADDVEKADGKAILDFWQAQAHAKSLARGQTTEGQGAPVTVSQALDNYRADLLAHGADPSNADRIRTHLPDTLAGKCVVILSVGDLRHFRDGLVAKGLKPGGINRCTKALKAALNVAADADTRIGNRSSWRIGLKLLSTGNAARRLVLPDEDNHDGAAHRPLGGRTGLLRGRRGRCRTHEPARRDEGVWGLAGLARPRPALVGAEEGDGQGRLAPAGAGQAEAHADTADRHPAGNPTCPTDHPR
jgi:hypothetical protein